MADAAPDILDLLAKHSIGVERYGSHVVKRVLSLLNDAEADIIRKLQARAGFEMSGVAPSSRETERLNELLETIRLINRNIHNGIHRTLEGDLTDLAAFEAEFTRDMAKAVTAVANFKVPSRQMLKAVATAQPFQGKILREWTKGMEAATLDRLKSAIRIGLVEGEGIDGIVRRVRGTASKRFKDGVMDISRRGAEGVVRTAVNHIQNRAHLATIAENPALYPRYRWVSVLDGRTSPICRARAGKVYEVGKGPTPPAHWNCRSRIAGLPYGYEMESELVYDEWLRKQPRADVEDIMGKTKARLFLDGKLKIDRFVNRQGDELTLPQLKDRHAALFRNLGIDP